LISNRELEIYFVGCYAIRLLNIPEGDKTIDLGEIKMLRNHLTDHIVIGGPSLPFSNEQIERDKKLRMDVLENYRINISENNVKPYFEAEYNPKSHGDKFLIFDFENHQTSSRDDIKGRIILYETNETLPGATIFDLRNNKLGATSDRYGNFNLEVKGDKRDLQIDFVGCYRIRIINIPKTDKAIDLQDIKMVLNHLEDHLVAGGPSRPFSEEQTVKDKKLRTDVLENYRVNILGRNLKPSFEGQYLVFDFDKNENE